MEAQKLLSFGFRYYKTLNLYCKGQKVQDIRVWGGESENVGLVTRNDVYVTVPKSKAKDVKAEIEIEPYVEAPVNKGQSLGTMIIKLDGKVQLRQGIVAETEVSEGGLIDRMVDKVKMMFAQMTED